MHVECDIYSFHANIPLASYSAVHTKELCLLYHIVCVLISVTMYYSIMTIVLSI